MQVQAISTAIDSDGEYITRRIRAGDKLLAEAEADKDHAKESRSRAKTEYMEAGKRLIDVRARLSRQASTPDKAVSGELRGSWLAWLQANGIAETTARRMIRYASTTEKQRASRRKREAEYRRAKRANKPTTYGWMASIRAFSRLTKQLSGWHKDRLEEKLGFSVSGRFDEEKARQIAGMAESLWGGVAPELNETDKQKVQRAIDRKIAEITAQAAIAVDREVAKRVEPEFAKYRQMCDEMAEKREHYEELYQATAGVMTREEFQLIRGCLHPDREPDQERKQRAFDIFNKLERKLVKH